MRLILLITLTLINTSLLASQPEYLKDAIIEVTLKDGKTYTYDANKYMIVERQKVTKEVKTTTKKSENLVQSIGILGGSSRSKLEVINYSNSTVEATVAQEIVLGLEYRVAKYGYFGEFVILNNETYLFGIGKEF